MSDDEREREDISRIFSATGWLFVGCVTGAFIKYTGYPWELAAGAVISLGAGWWLRRKRPLPESQ